MYTQEIVCPKCGKPAIVNVLKVKGSTSTPCQKCSAAITVQTDKQGEIERIHAESKSSLCVIATACVIATGRSPLNDHSLMLLRDFRDSYIASQDYGKTLIEEYYTLAPAIVAAINSQPNSKPI